ncbi:hypothetical protein C8R47DRAFT_1078632 [Mycena vitilis]|nr:hypothetical protein C8R47DRAFT_1078632 [Mycena vitilis]
MTVIRKPMPTSTTHESTAARPQIESRNIYSRTWRRGKEHTNKATPHDLENLLADGKTKAAKNRQRHVAPPFGEYNPGYFQEVPKGMPIQYYSPDWFNNRPPQARRKLKL